MRQKKPPLSCRILGACGPIIEKPLVSHLEGLGCEQGGLVDLPQPFDVGETSHSQPSWQNSVGTSYAPAVEN